MCIRDRGAQERRPSDERQPAPQQSTHRRRQACIDADAVASHPNTAPSADTADAPPPAMVQRTCGRLAAHPTDQRRESRNSNRRFARRARQSSRRPIQLIPPPKRISERGDGVEQQRRGDGEDGEADAYHLSRPTKSAVKAMAMMAKTTAMSITWLLERTTTRRPAPARRRRRERGGH